jgi:hypothetical protein
MSHRLEDSLAAIGAKKIRPGRLGRIFTIY